MKHVLIAVAVTLCGLGPVELERAEPRVTLLRLPAGGIQPQVAIDSRGLAHVVYFAGDPANGDVFYARVAGDSFSAPIRINSSPGSAIATGTVRGARIAIGRNGRVHVAWNGSSQATPSGGSTPMLYTRSNDAGTAFEPQRNLLQFTGVIDGGGAIGADARGRVFVAWHGNGPGARDEGARRVWLATSADDGRTFARERAVSAAETGACGCCGMDGLVDSRGQLLFLYRSAREVMNRDSYLLASTDTGRTFRSILLQPWNVGVCPMSLYDLAEGAGRTLAAWETNKQIQYTDVTAAMAGRHVIVTPPGAPGSRRHPSLAINSHSDVLMSWSEGTGWQKGGLIAWQVFNRSDQPTATAGRQPDLAVWSMPAAFARPDGSFTVLY